MTPSEKTVNLRLLGRVEKPTFFDERSGVSRADFDIRPHSPQHMDDEGQFGYYFRDQKSVVTRVPESCGGVGHYIQGNQKDTFPALYRALRTRAEEMR